MVLCVCVEQNQLNQSMARCIGIYNLSKNSLRELREIVHGAGFGNWLGTGDAKNNRTLCIIARRSLSRR